MKRNFFIALMIFTCHLITAQETTPVTQTTESTYNLAGIDVKPNYPGGIAAFYTYVTGNYKLPSQPGLNGNVFVTFVIEKDGSIVDVRILRDLGFGTGEEAVRVLQNSPKWIPGEQNGKKVRVQYSLPIKVRT